MKEIWKEREKALENQFIYKQEQEKLEKMRKTSSEEYIKQCCKNRCPKCGDEIQPVAFRGVPLDKCPSCGGVWLGPKDLEILAGKDHRTWFDKWFRQEEQ